MIKSMTGFGKASVECGNKKIVVEIKSLNSKQLDVSLRLPGIYREREMEIRNRVKAVLERGKVEISVYTDQSVSDKEVCVNRPVVERYFSQMLETAAAVSAEVDRGELLQTVMRFPETLKQPNEELNEEEWAALQRGIEQALEEVERFRIQEGDILKNELVHRIGLIGALAAEVPFYETKRVENIRQRLADKLKEWNEVKNIDQNRLEQEIIYYLEKLDITEEKVRLDNHCNYFITTINEEEAPGRKLGFIAQEIGREINTMGSKANDHSIQKLVVRMKDELEKIKEQSLNIL
ncbi:MAG: YicC family protein [Culturomica sp.]|jgi:uncharacterized protein (TIGR00255 family)|nr:YicC family protein [Culturomica sp.]